MALYPCILSTRDTQELVISRCVVAKLNPMNGTRTGLEVNEVEWASTDVCDGIHPNTGMPCILGDHKGYHRTADGAEWLDEE
jgi:hypothetical protein